MRIQYLRILGKRKLWICTSSLCTARFPGRNVVLIHYNYRQKSPNCCHLPKLHCCFDIYLEEPHTRHLLLSHQFWRCANRKDGCQFTSSGGLSLKHFQPSASISVVAILCKAVRSIMETDVIFEEEWSIIVFITHQHMRRRWFYIVYVKIA